jgi:predicted GNAT family acetyltransferase
MAQQPKDNRNFLEKRFGLPPLGELKGNLDSVNTLVQSLDREKIKQATSLLKMIADIQARSKPGELERVERIVSMIVQLSCNTNIPQVVSDVKSVVVALKELVKMLPPEMLKDMKIGDLIEDIKKEAK